MNKDNINERLNRLLNSLRLQSIQPMLLQSENKGQMLAKPGELETELKIEWSQAFAEGDPLAPKPETRIFRPKYELDVLFQESQIFHQVSVFFIAFAIADAAIFEELWNDDEVRKVFMEKQIQKTLWPLYRQHVLDGMSRLAMPPVSLPWLM